MEMYEIRTRFVLNRITVKTCMMFHIVDATSLLSIFCLSVCAEYAYALCCAVQCGGAGLGLMQVIFSSPAEVAAR